MKFNSFTSSNSNKSLNWLRPFSSTKNHNKHKKIPTSYLNFQIFFKTTALVITNICFLFFSCRDYQRRLLSGTRGIRWAVKKLWQVYPRYFWTNWNVENRSKWDFWGNFFQGTYFFLEIRPGTGTGQAMPDSGTGKSRAFCLLLS